MFEQIDYIDVICLLTFVLGKTNFLKILKYSAKKQTF